MNGDTTARLRGLRMSAVLIAAGISLAACGSSSSGGSTAGSTPPAVGSTQTASAPPTTTSGGGVDSSSFCGFAKTAQSQEATEAKAFTSDDPKKLAAYSAQAVAELNTFAAAAPSAIKPDVEVVVAGADKLFALLKKAGYDYTKVDPTSFEAINTPAFTKANEAIDSYLKSKCGISESGNG